jgi:hypothetical protein
VSAGRFLPFERWTIARLSNRDKSSAFHALQKDLTDSRDERGWDLFAASVFWLIASGPALRVFVALAAVVGIPWKLGLIGGGAIFLVGIVRGFQSYAAGRNFQRDAGSS